MTVKFQGKNLVIFTVFVKECEVKVSNFDEVLVAANIVARKIINTSG